LRDIPMRSALASIRVRRSSGRRTVNGGGWPSLTE
jgi:hypothetical protein